MRYYQILNQDTNELIPFEWDPFGLLILSRIIGQETGNEDDGIFGIDRHTFQKNWEIAIGDEEANFSSEGKELKLLDDSNVKHYSIPKGSLFMSHG